MRFSEFLQTEAGKHTYAHMQNGVEGMLRGSLKECVPHNSHVALGVLASSHLSQMGRNILGTLSDACYNDPEFAEKVWSIIRQEVLRDEALHE